MAPRKNTASAARQPSAPPELEPLLHRPGFLIRRLHQIHSALFAEETEGSSITPVQYSLLYCLCSHGELDQNSLAQHLGLERTSVAEVLSRLERRELLTRCASEQDRRVRLVKLTRRGRALVQRMSASVARAHERTLAELAPQERRLLTQMMQRLVLADASGRTPLLRAPEVD